LRPALGSAVMDRAGARTPAKSEGPLSPCRASIRVWTSGQGGSVWSRTRSETQSHSIHVGAGNAGTFAVLCGCSERLKTIVDQSFGGQGVVKSFRVELEELVKARFPVIYVETYEEQRLLSEIESVVGPDGPLRTPRIVARWSSTGGLEFPPGKTVPNTRRLEQALDHVLAADQPSVFVFLDPHPYFGAAGQPVDPTVVRRFREVAEQLKTNPHPCSLILVSPALTLPPDLQKDVTILDFTLPSEGEISSLLDEMIEQNATSGRVDVDLSSEDRERLVKAAQGLTLSEAENAFARAMVDDGRLDAADVDLVLNEKRQTIRKSGLLEYVPVDVDLNDVGGLENLKRWLLKRNNSWLAEAEDYGIKPPKGVLVTGVPGCGKSLTAKAIASLWRIPLLRMDIGKVFSGLVGSSEQNMRLAIKTAEAIAPCVLWIDEIEKGFANTSGSGDSGTSARVFGSFLTWMQEKTAPVFVIATANNIASLPPEFLRKGRFDEIFFVDLPTHAERMPIWQVHVGKKIARSKNNADFRISENEYARLSEISEGYSGAEIEQAVAAALFDAFAERRAVEFDDLLRSINTMVPLSVTQAEEIGRIREWADLRAVAATATEDRGDYSVSEVLPTAKPSSEKAQRGGRTVDF